MGHVKIFRNINMMKVSVIVKVLAKLIICLMIHISVTHFETSICENIPY